MPTPVSHLRTLAGVSTLRSALTLARPLLPAVLRLVNARCEGDRVTPAMPLFEGTRWFEPGQRGVTYEDVLLPYLAKEPVLTIVDPHCKTFRQIRNLRELLLAVASHAGGPRVDVHLVTATATGGLEWAIGQAQALLALQEELSQEGVTLRVSFDESNHDRWIETRNWSVLLGKGLDFWEAKDCRGVPQELRPVAKRFAITYHRAEL